MDIRCERCATEYEIEEAQIPETGLTIKCATCAHVFKVLRGVAAPPPLSLKLYRDGQVLSAVCPDAATLQQWIVEQRILPTDEVSIAGQPWRRLGDVPEFTTFFALLSMPPPAAMRTPTPAATPVFTGGSFAPVSGGTLSFQTPAPAASGTSSMATVQRPTLQWSPPPEQSAPTAVTQAKVAPVAPPTPDDNVRTIQIQLTPDMFPPARPGEAKRTTGSTPPVPPAPPERPEPAPTAAWPALPTNFGSEPLKLESLGGPPIPTASSTPRVTPAAKPAPASRPGAPAAKPAAKTPSAAVKSKPAPRKPEVDPDLAEFMTGRGNSRLVVGAIVVIAALGVGGYFAYPYILGDKGPSPAAKAAYENGRKLYLTDTASQFMLAENAYKEAIGATPGTFPQAEGALAELHAAWGEQLLERYNALQAEMTAMAAAGKDAKVLIPKVNELAASFKEKLSITREEVNAARKNDANSVEADRALLDYYRLENDEGHAATAAEALKTHNDPETVAHLAAWHAMDPKQAAAAEAELKAAIEREPGFVRARDWLAELHIHQGNTAAAIRDMEGILKIAPQHERAMEFLDAQKAAAGAAVVANAPANTPPAAAEEAKAPEASKSEPPKSEPKTETAKNEPKVEPHKSDASADKDKEPVIASGNVDALIDQAGRYLEKNKAAKALEFYDRALKVKPSLSDALYGRGLALYDMGRTDDAINAFKNTLGTNPKFGDAMIGIAEAYKREKKNKDAVKYYKEYLDMYPGGEQAAVAKANVDALQ